MSTETGKNARMTAEREALIDMAAGYLLSLSSEFDARTMTADEARAEVLAELARRTAAREIERLEAENARLEAEVERLEARIGRLEVWSAAPKSRGASESGDQ